jgi:hypothetical protein
VKFCFFSPAHTVRMAFQPAYGCFINVRDGAVLKNKRICSEGSNGLFLTCRKKQGQLHTYILMTVMIITLAQDLFLHTHYFIPT